MDHLSTSAVTVYLCVGVFLFTYTLHWICLVSSFKKVNVFFFNLISGWSPSGKACGGSWDIFNSLMYKMPEELWWRTNKGKISGKERTLTSDNNWRWCIHCVAIDYCAGIVLLAQWSLWHVGKALIFSLKVHYLSGQAWSVDPYGNLVIKHCSLCLRERAKLNDIFSG